MILQTANRVSDLIVKTIHTDLGVFGNRTDILIVEDGTVRGTSLLECSDPLVKYHYGGLIGGRQLDLLSPMHKPNDIPTEGPLDDGKPTK